jgi:FtsP/CotA-like multicopper oxidase with cupredoxin domain
MNHNKLSRSEFLNVLGIGSGAIVFGGGVTSLLNACASPNINSAVIGDGNEISVPLSDEVATKTIPDVEIALKAVPSEVSILDGSPTKVWQYKGELLKGPSEVLNELPKTYLGPTMRLRKGQNVRIHFSNELVEPSIIHWHGLHVPESVDGHPRFVIDQGEKYIYDFRVANRAGTYWYHPHPHGRTGPQAYSGLAGLLIVEDEEEKALELPVGEFDIPLVIQDRIFDSNNQFVYGRNGMMDQMMGFHGNRILVNGQPDFTLNVATRAYRLRLLNGSNSRIYKLAWEDGTPLTVIGTDGGLLKTPVQREYVTLAPAERIELWVDFSQQSAGNEIKLISQPFYGGNMMGSGMMDGYVLNQGDHFTILKVKINQEVTNTTELPSKLSDFTYHDAAKAVNRRSIRNFDLVMNMGQSWTLNRRTFEMTNVAQNEIVKLNDLEIWQFTKLGGGMGMGGNRIRRQGMMAGMDLPHPIHIHGLQFQVIARDIHPAYREGWRTVSSGYVDEGWKDTVLVMPGEQVKILIKFEDFTGLYLYHCHNLEHEDMGMMRNYRVEN